MCGINGIYAFRDSASGINPEELKATRDHMTARGPDGHGAWVAEDRRIGFGHRRLSIIDLSDAAGQPMASADGRYQLVFNGEIYNYRALRKQLQATGCVFRTHSDTEVLLHLYAQRGAAMLQELRGMFAFALWDSVERRLFLARDPYGIKPLYYTVSDGTLRFASQVKALLAGGAVSRETDPAGQVGFFLFGSVPEPFTWYADIKALPAGHSLTVDANGPTAAHAYHSIADVYCQAEAALSSDQATDRLTAPARRQYRQEQIREALLDSVTHHLEADVPVGAFLSAGIDSGALVGLMRDTGARDIQTLTLSFDEFSGGHNDESTLAEQVALRYGTVHRTRVVSAKEFQDDLPGICAAMDQPSIDGINTWFVAKAAQEQGLKVAVSGLGGDELFGGYPSFSDIPRWVGLLGAFSHVPALGKTIRRLLTAMPGPVQSVVSRSPKLPGLFEYGSTFAGAYLLRRGLFMPWELSDRRSKPPSPLLDVEVAIEGLRRLCPSRFIDSQLEPDSPKSDFARVATLESGLYMRNQLLRDTDWAGMAHSLEIRVPLVDSQLLKDIAPFTTSGKTPLEQYDDAGNIVAKNWLAQAPAKPLPSTVINRPKTGFATPLSQWLANESRDVNPAATYAYSRNWAVKVADSVTGA